MAVVLIVLHPDAKNQINKMGAQSALNAPLNKKESPGVEKVRFLNFRRISPFAAANEIDTNIQR